MIIISPCIIYNNQNESSSTKNYTECVPLGPPSIHPSIHSFTSGFQTEQSGVVNRNVHSTVSKFQVPLQKPICYSASLNCYLESITQLQTQTSGHDRLVHLDVHLQDRRLKKKHHTRHHQTSLTFSKVSSHHSSHNKSLPENRPTAFLFKA